ncbi:hypothetical protein [Stenotrophomonas sp. UBA7606]|uniref:hypothetical protein n=1 Tax=Stenotrophomonas sp. UBA7606 TaxID=1947559 RepID=UPI0025FDE062|nr:hypothetical protein [Stenotrophomonas sp. UBA7606]
MPNRHAIDASSARLQLPLLAIHCILGVAAREHSRANLLRQRSAGEHSRNQKRRSRRMGVASRIAEAVSREMVAEVRT